MLQILEILMLLAGFWGIATAKLPWWLLGAGRRYRLEGPRVRLLPPPHRAHAPGPSGRRLDPGNMG